MNDENNHDEQDDAEEKGLTLRGSREAGVDAPPLDEGLALSKRGKMGRPHTFSLATGLRAVELLRAGNYLETVAGGVGLSVRTLRNWRRAGKRYARDPRYRWAPGSWFTALTELGAMVCAPQEHLERWLAGFALACDMAEAEAEITAELVWRRAMAENPMLAPKFLERRFPKRWGATPAGPAVQVNTGAVEALTIIAPEEREP